MATNGNVGAVNTNLVINYWDVLELDTTPKLKSPEAIEHTKLFRRDFNGNLLWYYIEHFEEGENEVSHNSIALMLDTPPDTIPKYKFLLQNGLMSPHSYQVRERDKVYKCMYKKCRPTGTVEQEGGKSKKRYPKTKKRKARKNTRKSK